MSTTARPQVGDRVILTRYSRYLHDQRGTRPGSIGTVIELRSLDQMDTGVLVDWGYGPMVRCDLNEITRTDPGQHLLVEKPLDARCVLFDGTNFDEVEALAGRHLQPRNTGDWIIVDADGNRPTLPRASRRRRSGAQQPAEKGARLENTGGAVRRASTLAPTSWCCNDRLNSPRKRRE